ncbi:hypothetical protein [Elizabethkingia anophelis]|uniref:hypothetical protein n=1 Tax=Elizabethkingia anophelis TaxID=1117645 RepID=UPI0016096A67|nr:hypothetical protein [Elizabethkingia anophelis]
MDRQATTEKEGRTHNSGLAKVAVQCSADTFVVNQSLVLRINIYGKNRHLRQAANRYLQFPYSKTKLFLAANEEIFTILNNQMVKN